MNALSKEIGFFDFLKDPDFKSEIKESLPIHINAKRVFISLLTEVTKNSNLQKCTKSSIKDSILKACQAGLEIGGSFDQAYLVPYKDSKTFTLHAGLIIGYKGMIDIIHRTGKVINLHADVVYDSDVFDFEFGTSPHLKHKPDMNAKGSIICAYATASLVSGGVQMTVVKKNDIDRIANSSPTKKFWGFHYNEMAKKTALRRLYKLLPVSAEITALLEQEDKILYPSLKEDKNITSKSEQLLQKGQFAKFQEIEKETPEKQDEDKASEEDIASPALKDYFSDKNKFLVEKEKVFTKLEGMGATHKGLLNFLGKKDITEVTESDLTRLVEEGKAIKKGEGSIDVFDI